MQCRPLSDRARVLGLRGLGFRGSGVYEFKGLGFRGLGV